MTQPKNMKPKVETFVPVDPPLPRSLVQPLVMWRHYRGGLYETIGIALESTNGPDVGKARVVYRSLRDDVLHVRDADQFLDGRFVPLP